MRRIGWLALLCVALVATDATADDGEAARAAKLFEEGASNYRAGRFEVAIGLFEEAHRLSNEPVLLFNLAKAYEGKGALAEAIAAYERYLVDAKDLPDRGAISARIETLRAQLDTRAVLEKRAEEERLRAERAEREQREGSDPSPVPWIVAGAGVVGIAIASAFAATAKGKEDDVAGEPVQLRAEALRSEAEDFALGANIAFAIGGALTVAGVTWGIVDVVSSTASEPAVSVRLGPTSVGLLVVVP